MNYLLIINLILKIGKIGKYLKKYLALLELGEVAKFKKIGQLLGYSSIENFIKDWLKDPQKIVNKMDDIGVEGRKRLIDIGGFEKEGDILSGVKKENGQFVQHESGDIEEKFLSSSWQYWGQFEWTSSTIGTLTLMTKFSPKEYIYPNMPARIWELMKAATGSHGSGSGSVFWTWFRQFRKSRTYTNMKAALSHAARTGGVISNAKR